MLLPPEGSALSAELRGRTLCILAELIKRNKSRAHGCGVSFVSNQWYGLAWRTLEFFSTINRILTLMEADVYGGLLMGGLSGFSQGLTGVLGPALPKRKTVLILVVGFMIGLLWAYIISPVIYYDGDPRTLHQNFQDEWVKLLADRQDATNADLTDHISNLLTYVDNPLGIVDTLLSSPAEAENYNKLLAIRTAAERAEPNAVVAPQPNTVQDVLPFIVGPLVLVLVFVVLATIWNLLIYPFLEPSLSKLGVGRGSGPRTVSNETAASEVKAIRDAKKAMAENKTDFTSTLGAPLMQKMSVYALGRGQYDDSFSIEDANERFLGECGAGISETIGVGDPKKVTAVEVWLFDKDDYVRTVTKVFASPHAFNDSALRTKLEPKGDLVLAEPGAVVVLETSSLRLQARIVDIEYGTGPLPTNSYFEKMTIELAAWRKQPGQAPTRVEDTIPATPLEAPVAPRFTAPPSASAPASASQFNAPAPRSAAPQVPPPTYQPPAPAGRSPFAPPAQMPQTRPQQPPQDDDPFGGTGDFNPV